jgi:hypothetical protein
LTRIARTRRSRSIWAVGAATLALLAAPTAALASGQVFFGGWYDNAIGSVKSDGSEPKPNLVVNDETIPLGMAVSGDYIYWESNSSGVRIGRSHLDGSEADTGLVGTDGGPPSGDGVSISGGRVYWTEKRNSTGFGPLYLGSANLDGSNPQVRFLSPGTNAEGTAFVSGSYVFFVIQKDVRGVERYSVARSRVDGKGSRRIIAANRPYAAEGLVGNASHVYWVEENPYAGGGQELFIARASVNASSLNTRWRRIPSRGCHVKDGAGGTALGGRYLFIGCPGGGRPRIPRERAPRDRAHGGPQRCGATSISKRPPYILGA